MARLVDASDRDRTGAADHPYADGMELVGATARVTTPTPSPTASPTPTATASPTPSQTRRPTATPVPSTAPATPPPADRATPTPDRTAPSPTGATSDGGPGFGALAALAGLVAALLVDRRRW